MKYCPHCGQPVDDNAVVCVKCGCATNGSVAYDDAPSTGFAILGFFFPLIGLILYLVNKDNRPQKAKSAGKGALIGFIVSVVLGIVYGIVMGVVLGSAIAATY